jgi:hypothetical protein
MDIVVARIPLESREVNAFARQQTCLGEKWYRFLFPLADAIQLQRLSSARIPRQVLSTATHLLSMEGNQFVPSPGHQRSHVYRPDIYSSITSESTSMQRQPTKIVLRRWLLGVWISTATTDVLTGDFRGFLHSLHF